jgi:hypothetical protein
MAKIILGKFLLYLSSLPYYLLVLTVQQDGGILVVPSVADSPLKLNAKKGFCSDFHDRTFSLSSIASMSGCCQVI